jgi:carboxyl-terminal processing protease
MLGFSLALASMAAISLAQGEPISQEQKDAVLERMGAIIGTSAFVPGVDFSKWDEFVSKHKGEIEKAKTEEQFAEAVNGALQEFGFSHIVLATPRAARARVERKVVGIGIMVQPEEGGLRVINVFPDTPAEEVGIQTGDLVVEADGKKITPGMTLVGEEGSEVTFAVMREKEKKTFTVKRRKYSNIRKDTISWPSADTAVLTVHTFDLSYDRNRIDDLMEEAAKSKNLILDLRNNGGGVVLNMLHLLGHFLPRDATIGTFINRGLVRQYVKETDGKPTDLKAIAEWADEGKLRPIRNSVGLFKGKVAVLVNGGSGSASEITAAALREHLGSPIIGTKSAGAVLVSIMSPLPNGFSLQYPLMDYITYKGVRLEGNPIVPDSEAPTPKFKEPDTAIEKAVALLAKNGAKN